MKRYKPEGFCGYSNSGHTLEDVIAYELDGEDYGRGAIEEALATGSNCTGAVGRLVAVLHRKGALTLDEVSEIVGTKIVEVPGDG